MNKGRPPISNSLKKLRGTDQPVRMRDEGNFERLTEVSPPKVLTTKRSKQIFKTKADQLIKQRVLTPLDLEQLTFYAYCADTAFTCMQELKAGLFNPLKDEKGVIYKFVENPHLPLLSRMIDQCNRIGSDFGFSPISRSKVKTAPDEKPHPEGLEEFLT